MTPLLAEPLCCTVSNCFVSDHLYLGRLPAGRGVRMEKIRRKIRELGIKPAFLRRLGPSVTKEEFESVYQKIESLTRIFEEM